MAAEVPTTARYGVAGDPVAHSRSPQMHEAACRELGISAIYQRLPIPAELFDETVRALPGSGFAGINVTIPHKQAAAALADERSAAVTAIGAANTLSFRDGRILAENTDAPGLINALGTVGPGQRALVLGAGGTARAAVHALVGAGVEVQIFNRTAARAAELAEEFAAEQAADTSSASTVDLIVNTTSLGMGADDDEHSVLDALQLDLAAVRPETKIVDFVYRQDGSPLTSAARAEGLTVVDGLDLLAHQGALSFELWFNRPAPLATMRAALTP